MLNIRLAKTIGRVTAFSLFMYFLLVLLASTVYGFISLLDKFPLLVGIPVYAAIGIMLFFIGFFWYDSVRRTKEEKKGGSK